MYHPRYNDILVFGGVIAFLVGILVRSLVFVPVSLYIFIILSAFSFSVFVAKAHRVYALFVLLFGVLFILGCLRFELKEIVQKDTIENFEQAESYYGFVVKEPEYYSNHQRFVVRLESQDSRVKILVRSDRYPEVSYGDKVRIEGELLAPENFVTDTGREFQYEKYLLKDNIYFTMPFAEVLVVDAHAKKGVKYILYSGKEKFLDAIMRVIPDPESSLLGGILLGVDQSLGKELEQKFIDTGTIHIVVLSGYNVTIVSEAIVKTLESFLPKTTALSFGAFGIILFALLSGAGTTTIRASLMGLLGLLARVTKRTYDIFRAIFIAGFVMVFINPFTLPYDVSFQLSFIATLGLVLVTPLVEGWKFIQHIPRRFGIREIFCSTIAVQITVLPFILYKMGTLSIIAPLANVLVLPLIPLSMGFGFLAGMVELITGLGSNPISWISFGLLHYSIKIVEFLASFSWSALTVKIFPLSIVLVSYALICFWIFKNRSRVWKK